MVSTVVVKFSSRDGIVDGSVDILEDILKVCYILQGSAIL